MSADPPRNCGGPHATTEMANRVRAVQEQLGRLRELRQITRDAPDRLRRDAAIIAYSRALDSLIEDLGELDDMGLLSACIRRLDPDKQQPEQD